MNLGNRKYIIHHIEENTTAINRIASQSAVGGNRRTTEYRMSLVIDSQSLVQYQSNTVFSYPDTEIVIHCRVERTPGNTVIVRNLPEIDIGVRSEALYRQIDKRTVAGTSLGARTAQDKLRAGEHFHVNAGFIAVATDGVACLYRIYMVDSRLNYRSAVGCAVRISDIERGIPFVSKSRFPIINYFRPQFGFAVVSNNRVFVRRQNRCGQYVHVNHPRLFAVGIETPYFGTGGNDGVNAVAVLQAVGLIGLFGAYQASVQIPFHGGIITGIGQTGNYLRGIEQHVGEQADGFTGEYIHIHTQGLGRLYGQGKVRGTNRILDIVERAMFSRRIHISLRPNIFVDTRIGNDNAVGTRAAGNPEVSSVPVVADGRIGNIAAAVNQMGAYGKVAALTLGAVGGKQEEYRRITLRTLNRQGIANRLITIALGLTAHFINQGIVFTGKASLIYRQYAVVRNHFAVYIPLVVYLGGNRAGTVGKFDILQFNVAGRIHRRSRTMHRNFRIKVLVGRTFLNTANQYLILVVVDITVLTDNEQHIAFLILAAGPNMVAAFVNPQTRLTVFPTQIERVVGIITAPIVPPAGATVMGATFVVDTHHRRTFRAADHITVHKVAV